MTTIKTGSIVRRKFTQPPEMVVTGVAIDLQALQDDPHNPIVKAVCEWETPEEEEGLGPVRHTIAVPLTDLDDLTPKEEEPA